MLTQLKSIEFIIPAKVAQNITPGAFLLFRWFRFNMRNIPQRVLVSDAK